MTEKNRHRRQSPDVKERTFDVKEHFKAKNGRF